MVADRLIGAALERGFYRQQHGDDIVTRYVLDSTREDLIVFGSSRASHHYKTRLAEQKLGFPVYNGGRDNMALGRLLARKVGVTPSAAHISESTAASSYLRHVGT